MMRGLNRQRRSRALRRGSGVLRRQHVRLLVMLRLLMVMLRLIWLMILWLRLVLRLNVIVLYRTLLEEMWVLEMKVVRMVLWGKLGLVLDGQFIL
jgi:hypothetical protein